MEKYLKSEQYYIDLYDRHTVDFCRDITLKYNKSIKDRIGKKMTEKDRANLAAHELVIYFETGESYLKKEDTIKKWIDRDKEKDDLLENTNPPNNIYCNKCGEAMFVETKTLHREEKVLFIFRCHSRCKEGRGIFDNGEKWIIKPELCNKCDSELSKKHERKGNKIFTYYNCTNCDFKKTEELDLSIKETKEKIDKFFNRDRSKFCLSKKQGEEYYNTNINMERLVNMMDDIKEKDKNKEIYEKASKLKKLTIVELKKLLNSKLNKNNYIKLKFGDPQIDKYVVINFTIQDKKSDRQEYDSKNESKKLIINILSNTNWRLMSDGVSYRLGILSGRLKGYESEEDLIKLVK